MKLELYQTKFSQGRAQIKVLRSFLSIFLILLLSYSGRLTAQAELICDGTTQTLEAIGIAEEFVVPFDSSISQIELIAHGADGGFADLGNNCFSEGGAGATATAIFELGDAEGAIPYGSTIRFVVGVAGEKGTGGTVLGTGNTYGGGGGGTGILYKKPDSDQWDVIVVAGGGGGAYQGSVIGICVDSKTGQGGRAGTSGGDGNGANGGKGGQVGSGGMAGGLDGFEVSGAGGGAYTKGEGLTCINFNGSDEVAEGQQGFPNGGAGGGNEGCVGSTFRDGGFGFGGGASGQGGGGGGGGFSGGGGGGNAGRGGGGGSHIVAEAVSAVIEEGDLSATTEDGFAQYRCIKRTEPVDETPEVSCVGEVLPVALNADGISSINPNLISVEDLDPGLTYTLDKTDFSCDSLGQRFVILKATNSEGLSDSCFAIINIVDEDSPEVDCPPSATVNCDADFSVAALGMATVIDNCSAGEPEMSEVVVPGDCAGEQTITRSWTAADASGNTGSCDQVIVVSDDIAPVCENCPADITVACGEMPAIPEIVVTDKCDAAPTINLEVTSSQTSEGCTAFGFEEVRTWTITDACGNSSVYTQTVTVVDDAAPECLDCPADITVSCDAVPDVPSVEVSDNCDPNPTIELAITSTRSESGCAVSDYEETRTWTITDACGNSSVYIQTVTVIDDIAPECLDCPADITVSCNAVPDVPSLDVSDNCDSDPTVGLTVTSTQTNSGCGAYSYEETRTWTIADACGNAVTHVQLITVEDVEAPVITCPPTITVTCDNSPEFAGIPSIMDNCDPDPDYDFSDEVLSGDCDWDCMLQRTWTVTDACGNTNSCVQTIQQSVLELMEEALSADVDGDALADPLTIGRLGRHSLTVTAAGAACLLDWMPNSGGSAWPLIRTDFMVDGTDCAPEGLPLGADGKLNNPLIAETLLLGIKLRLDPSLGDVVLADLDCNIHPIVFQGLPRNPDIADLYQQVNLVVGNIIGLPFVEHYADVLECINGTYDLCPGETTTNMIQAGSIPTVSVSQPVSEVRVFPNPVRRQFWIDLSPFAGQNGQLSLIDAVGQTVMSDQINEITSEPVAVSIGNLSGGPYVLQVRIGEQLINRRLIVQ